MITLKWGVGWDREGGGWQGTARDAGKDTTGPNYFNR